MKDLTKKENVNKKNFYIDVAKNIKWMEFMMPSTVSVTLQVQFKFSKCMQNKKVRQEYGSK